MWGLEAPYNTRLRLVLYVPLDPTFCALLLIQHSCPCFNYYKVMLKFVNHIRKPFTKAIAILLTSIWYTDNNHSPTSSIVWYIQNPSRTELCFVIGFFQPFSIKSYVLAIPFSRVISFKSENIIMASFLEQPVLDLV